MDWLIGVASVAIVCALVGLLLFVLMYLMAAPRQSISRDDVFVEEQRSEEA
ncbi:MAG: hypothetical protein ACXVDA_22760 [Ktedonobacterales bacterium]